MPCLTHPPPHLFLQSRVPRIDEVSHLEDPSAVMWYVNFRQTARELKWGLLS